MWRISEALKKLCKLSPPLRSGELVYTSPTEEANLLATTFEKSHNNQMADDPDTAYAVERSIQQVARSELPADNDWLVSPREVDKTIRKLKSKNPGAPTG